jgi:hypothetical protein
MNDRERTRVRAYRRAAGKVFHAYKPIATSRMQATLFATGPVDLFPESEFVRLLTAIRLVYMEREPGYFFHANNILGRYGDQDLRSEAELLRTRWHEALQGGYDLVFLTKDRPSQQAKSREDSRQFRPEDVLDTFLNAEYFHQDEARILDLEQLENLGPIVTHFLHVTVWKLTRIVLMQDLLIADLVNESRLPFEEVFGVAPPPRIER